MRGKNKYWNKLMGELYESLEKGGRYIGKKILDSTSKNVELYRGLESIYNNLENRELGFRDRRKIDKRLRELYLLEDIVLKDKDNPYIYKMLEHRRSAVDFYRSVIKEIINEGELKVEEVDKEILKRYVDRNLKSSKQLEKVIEELSRYVDESSKGKLEKLKDLKNYEEYVELFKKLLKDAKISSYNNYRVLKDYYLQNKDKYNPGLLRKAYDWLKNKFKGKKEEEGKKEEKKKFTIDWSKIKNSLKEIKSGIESFTKWVFGFL